jgi:RimJ/RimL family protein N-acetyltransferase
VFTEKGIVLRELLESDLLTFFHHENEPEAHRMAAYPPRTLENFLQHWREKILFDPGAKKRTILFDGTAVGNVLSWEFGDKRLVGYWIGQTHWGQGIATAAVREFIVQVEPTRPLSAYVATLNGRSSRVLRNCGFVPVGEPTVGSDGVEEQLFQLN